MSKLLVLLVSLTLVFATCPATTLIGSSQTSQIETAPGVFVNPTVVTPNALWVTVPRASWVWKDSISATGDYTFVNTFVMADWLYNRISAITLSIACDNSYAIVFNGFTIAPAGSGNLSTIGKYNLKPYVFVTPASQADVTNTLRITGTSPDGDGGIAYTIVLEF